MQEFFAGDFPPCVVVGVNQPSAGLSSNCFVVGDFVILTGLTARDAVGKPTALTDARQQAVVLVGRMKALIEAAGGKMSAIVKLNCFLTAPILSIPTR